MPNSSKQSVYSQALPLAEAAQAPAVLTVKDAAEYLRISETTVLRLAAQGLIPGARIGRQWRFSKNVILNLVNHPDWMKGPVS